MTRIVYEIVALVLLGAALLMLCVDTAGRLMRPDDPFAVALIGVGITVLVAAHSLRE